ncbi:MAG: Uncharacterized protein AUK63_1686 [bacterium P3]|nr:MAG: Uncharacterized protein AUK63_1686 [bacterium P3]KWW39063.1 MAG: Uncharacterized protein F083_2023 [bacterium F083]
MYLCKVEHFTSFMKHIVFIALLFSCIPAYSQSKASIDTRRLMDRGWQSDETHTQGKKRNTPSQIDLLAKVTADFRAEWLTSRGIVIGSRAGNIVTLRMTPERVPLLDSCKGVVYYQVSHQVAPECNEMRADTRSDSVQAGYGLPQGYDGEGVIIGVTDWGFDYKHTNYNGGGQNNRRILRAWDHFRLAGPAPEGFTYGTELVGYAALKEAQCDTSGLYGYGTHGTHVTGIAAGRGINGDYAGQAPKADLLMCSFGLGESQWIDAVSWMKRVADEEGKRLVINSSWGMYTFSTLDGTSLVSQAIDSYSDSGVVFVTSAGNNGDVMFHLDHRFEGADDTLRTTARSFTGGVGNELILWGEAGNNFAAAVGIEHDGVLTTGPFFQTAAEGYACDTFLTAGSDTAWYNVIWEAANPLNQRPHINFEIKNHSGGRWHLFVTAESGVVHAWNLNVQQNHAGNTGYAFESQGIDGYSHGDAAYGVSEPGCARKTIAVAAHQSDHYNTITEQMQSGALASFSSHGPLLGGGRKPEISAPGVNVVSSLSSFTTETYPVVAHAISGGRSYPFTRMSGTSMSSPAVTGVVALMLQANPNLSVDQVREILFTTARNDSETGPIQAGGEISDTWGWGKVDAYHAVLAAIELLSIDEQRAKRMPPSVYPNPATQRITLRTGSLQPVRVTIYSMDGRSVWNGTAGSEAELDIDGWRHGVYIVCVRDNESVQTVKFIKQ